MAEASVKSSLPRKSAFSCEACRKRKVKCNGASPSCARCAARGEVCVYSLAPTLSYTKTLEAKIAQLEEALAKLQAERARELENASKPSPQGSGDFSKYEPDEREDGLPDLSADFEGLKVEDDGRISFHGPTSLFHLPSGMVNEIASSPHTALELEARKERLINNAWRERAFEQLAAIPEPFQYLLDFHWCWIQPLFNFVYRPAFTRDMKVSGPYYSDILLNAILSHSVRWCKGEPKVGPLLEAYDGGAKFYQSAVSGVFEALRVGYPKIPTVQTLLLLSAQECGRGNRTQAWLYSGMAFRLVEDLGISVDSRKYSRSIPFSDEDIEIRNRLFWSCYFWDKLISLYFGRSPAIKNSRVSPPRMILDDTSEIEPWVPHGVVFPEGMHYPPTQAHSTSCFMKMCGLAEILNQIIIHIYDPLRQTGENEFINCVQEQEKNLARWWDELPDYLRLVATNLPPYCPPSHIVTLNSLYHTINILLHRPILCGRPLASKERQDTNHLIQCMTSATSIIALFDLYRRTFGDSHVVLSLAYSVYTAASIFLLEIQALKYAAPATLDKVKFCIIALERVKTANPVINTGLGLIYQELRKLQIDIHVPMSAPHPTVHLNPQPQQQQPQPQPQVQRQTPPPHSQHPPRSHQPSRHVSPSQHSPAGSTPGSVPAGLTTATTGSTSPPVLPGYQFQQQPIASFELPQLHQQTVPSSFPGQPDHLAAAAPHPQGGGMPGMILNPDGTAMTTTYEITPEVFEAFSYVEPITTNMTSGYDSGWGMMGPGVSG
ncbi:hypothetical protein VTN77DRAFT_7722 [Rasamsonia byssochlamydoides]|uniref:uncharacterized protein n=1 Tax=Rasamsonia byssochlamydoides TaxID=89139 RepID=UPI003744283B